MMLNDFIALFYPRVCVACHASLIKGEEILCTSCLSQLPKTAYHRFTDNPVSNRLAGRLPIQFASAFLKFRKGGLVQSLLHELKYNNRPEIGIRMGHLYGTELIDSGMQNNFDLIVPVPLHASRMRKRGYNQSAMFAEGLSEALKIEWQESISLRVSATNTQTRKGRADRWSNVKDAFSVGSIGKIAGKRILLVDDVITTGATIEACGLHLIESGCASLSVACIAEA
ncbi:MAG TPA: ComF family protein [Cyclobacteriaceae bacterium]|nr:ComF family protein [Cyclobacteriaceae bacterium]